MNEKTCLSMRCDGCNFKIDQGSGYYTCHSTGEWIWYDHENERWRSAPQEKFWQLVGENAS